jgi:hypothetical protein
MGKSGNIFGTTQAGGVTGYGSAIRTDAGPVRELGRIDPVEPQRIRRRVKARLAPREQ